MYSRDSWSESQRVNPKASRLPAFPRVRSRFPLVTARYSRRSLLTAHLTHGVAVRLRGLLSVVLAMFAVRCSRRSRWSRLALFASRTRHTAAHGRAVRFRGASRLAAPGHRPGACEGCEDDRRESSKTERGAKRPVSREPSKTNGGAVSRANEGSTELVLSVDEERRPGDRAEGGLRMSERRSREQKAEERSRLGGSWRGAGAVTTSLRPQFSAPSPTQFSKLAFGFSLNTATDSVLRERNTPNHRSQLVSFAARVRSRIHVSKHYQSVSTIPYMYESES